MQTSVFQQDKKVTKNYMFVIIIEIRKIYKSKINSINDLYNISSDSIKQNYQIKSNKLEKGLK